MWEAFPTIILVLGGWYAYAALKARETATRIVRQACKQHGLQLLDDTVHGARIRFARDAEGVSRLRRTFAFEFSDDGISRRAGNLVMLGAHVESLHLEPYYVQ
jgi:Protein of unknown function (DUF3301)